MNRHHLSVAYTCMSTTRVHCPTWRDLLCQHVEELAKIDGAIAVLVHFIDHILELRTGRMDTQAFHHSAQFTCINRSIIILYIYTPCWLIAIFSFDMYMPFYLIEKSKGVLVFLHLLWRKLISLERQR